MLFVFSELMGVPNPAAYYTLELQPLLLIAVFRASSEIVNRLFAAGVEGERLVCLRQKAGGPNLIIAARPRVVQHDVRGQVLVLRSEPVRHPRAERSIRTSL